MDELTTCEGGLFLMFLSANFEWDPITDSINGELPEDAVQYILKCIRKLALFQDVTMQDQLEEAIQKYNDLKEFSTTTAEIIQHCAKPLLESPMDRDMVYYLCSEILALNGRVMPDSKEEKFLDKLAYYTKVDSTFSSAVFFIEIINSSLNTE